METMDYQSAFEDLARQKLNTSFIDEKNNLAWKPLITFDRLSWWSAITLRYYDGYKLPSIQQLQTLVDTNQRHPPYIKEHLYIGSGIVWSSTYIFNYHNPFGAWSINFYDKTSTYTLCKDTELNIVLVKEL
jgi:hypothetical protein